MKMETGLTVNPDLDIASLAETYRTRGRVRIPHILSQGAPELFSRFRQSDDWIQLINREGGAHEIPYSRWTAPRFAGRKVIEREMNDRACDGFQYSYAAMRVPQEGETSASRMMTAIARFVASAPVQTLLEGVTGVQAPTFTDGQATAYGPGDFLTGHDDDLAGAKRKTAFVLGLTPQWRLEWGGLLMFHTGESPYADALLPQFNTLDLFAVPQYHSVSLIAPYAPRRRFAITGWLSDR